MSGRENVDELILRVQSNELSVIEHNLTCMDITHVMGSKEWMTENRVTLRSIRTESGGDNEAG